MKDNFIDVYEKKWDQKLNIMTVGRDDLSEDENHYPYEPTPYTVLERMIDSGYLSKNSDLIDYGSGKGRVDLFLNYQLGCKTTGIEFDPRFYELAQKNHKESLSTDKVQFLLMNAEDYEVDNHADSFYFFNPFSIKILRSVIAKILMSWYEVPRKLQLFFYYPSDEYMSYLMSVDEFVFSDEIDCRDLFDGNDERERIVIFTIE